MSKSFDAVVVGCGVVGLSTALRLRQTGRSVCILTADPPERTTSNLAAAVWYPTEFGEQGSVLDWARRTFEVFYELSGDLASGVVMRDTLMLLRSTADAPWWAPAVGGVERADPLTLAQPYCDGYRFVVPLVEMPIYLPWLFDRFVASGGVVKQGAIRSLQQAAAYADMVVNCSGMGARELCGDTAVVPARGQVVRVQNPGLELSLRDEGNPKGRTYIHPRTHDCILGGTFEVGNWDTTPDPKTAAEILERCAELVPKLAGTEVLEHHVGLRPKRSGGVRLEVDTEAPGGMRLVHNYGHGGAGVTLSWGCAEEAVALVEQVDFPVS